MFPSTLRFSSFIGSAFELGLLGIEYHRNRQSLRTAHVTCGYRGVIEFLDVPDFHHGSSDVPVWSIDSQTVFYTAKVDNNVELFQIALDGEPIRLTTSVEGTLHYHLKPSPDGNWIVYGSKRNGIRNLYAMRLSKNNLDPGNSIF